LIADDVAAGRLILPFDGPALPARSYHTYVPEALAEHIAVRAFCDWLSTLP
jgi:LysR family glycine cleavage system transcriptional activator